MPRTDRLLVKLRGATALGATASRANLRPLHDEPAGPATPFGLDGAPRWFLADLPGDASPWDLAHARVADQLGVAESDVLFAEPDLEQNSAPDENAPEPGASLAAAGETCLAIVQDGGDGRAVGPRDGWHLDDAFSQLESARKAVTFTEPRTRIGHVDTGYYAKHVTLPRHLNRNLQRNFVERDGTPGNAEDPDNRVFLLDNSGHGTGTIGVLAGGAVAALPGRDIGGAPEAEVVPLRIADSVVLWHTSSFARALAYAVDNGCDVITMSMGGVPSEAWRETVDRAYLAGLCMVTAAGNNFGGLPTRHVVYPARYGRVIAACGVMADGRPYAHLQHHTMEGNFGPDKVMGHALAAYTPNVPWAVFGCPDLARMNGGGTSSATPQIAAAAALWLEKYKAELPRDWRRVEAVRHALFMTAKPTTFGKELGRGILQANLALGVRPLLGLPQTKSDNDSFSFLRVITGLGLVEPPPRERMFNLELAQRWLRNPILQGVVSDPDAEDVPAAELKKLMEAIVEDEGASLALRKHVASRYRVVTGGTLPSTPSLKAVVPEVLPACEAQPALQAPPHRRLRAYAMDPSASGRLQTAATNEVTLSVPWETLAAGPQGEYLAVEDVDASGRTWDGVDLDAPSLLAQDGWAPSEGNPQFHQQMVYAVAMQTIGHFERSLGRPVLWRHRADPSDEFNDSIYERRLKVRPHALRQANAYYSPNEIALLFGYFEAAGDDPGDHVPGSRVYSCLSHDIIAHETTHAILDGMHRRFNEPTNPDVLALHEAFADIVALMQHFTIREPLAAEMGRIRGDLSAASTLGSLAVQFGRATGGRGALREAIGRMEGGVWRRFIPNPSDLQARLTPHARGAVLVAAVFDAFIAIYESRTADLLRIGTGGTGIRPDGALHPDLVNRLTDEAATSAGHVLSMCIRALDYLPPVDVTFFEYLRALITADFDVVPDDRHHYRVAFVEAFRRRGIHPIEQSASSPEGFRSMSVDTLRWRGVDYASLPEKARQGVEREYGAIVTRLKHYADQCLYLQDRAKLFERTRGERFALHDQLKTAFAAVPEFAGELGLDLTDPKATFEVHELRPAMRMSPDGRHVPQVVVALTQSKRIDPKRPVDAPGNRFRGGATLIVDLSVPEVKYGISKSIASRPRQERAEAFARAAAADPLRALFLSPPGREPFAALHFLAEDGL
jgi:hypothetical protein